MKYKPGIRTTEFWATVLVVAFNSLALGGVVNFESQTELENLAATLAGAGVTMATVIGYIWSRTAIKGAK